MDREADEMVQVQLALHKLERARLEVVLYSEAIAKVAEKGLKRDYLSGELAFGLFTNEWYLKYYLVRSSAERA
jgi:hypothetical protein